MAEEVESTKQPSSVVKDGRLLASVTIPDEEMQRCDLLLISRREGLPEMHINGEVFQPSRTNSGKGWRIVTLDLRKWHGKSVEISIQLDQTNDANQIESWLIMDRPVLTTRANTDPRLPYPISHRFRRQTIRL